MQRKLAVVGASVAALGLIAGVVMLSQQRNEAGADRPSLSIDKNRQANQQTKEVQQVEELKSETLQEGTGEAAKKGDRVTVHYRGTLLSGEQFDASYDRGEPFTFELGAGNVIQGWDEGLVGMKEGEKRKLIIPAEMAYGNRAMGSIPANSPLVFEVEMLEVL